MQKSCTLLILSLLAFCQVQGQVMVHTANGGYLDTKINYESYSQDAQERLNAVIEKAIKKVDELAEGEKSAPSFGSPISRSSHSFVSNPEYFYSVSAYYDHNHNANAYHDLNCASLSYDSHRGTDFFAFPFYWYQYENEMLDVIAAEQGEVIEIIEEAENCLATDNYGVYVVIRHGSYISLYAHLKEGTLNPDLREGYEIDKGEYIAKVGFSGNSASGPHLHFQVNTGVNLTIDPYLTTCQSSSRSQDLMEREQEKEYRFSELLSLTTHEKEPLWANSCDDSYMENPFFGDNYQIGDTLIIIAAVRDFSANQQLSVSLTDSEGIIKQQWRLDMEDITGMNPSPRHVSAAYSKLYYLIQDDDPVGDWSIGAAIREGSSLIGTSLSKTCTVEPFTSAHELGAAGDIRIFPNPCHASLEVHSGKQIKIGQLELMDLSGRVISVATRQSGPNTLEISTTALQSGIYLVKLTTDAGKQIIQRILKQ